MEIDLTKVKSSLVICLSALAFCIFEFFSYPDQIELHTGFYDLVIYFLGAIISSSLLLVLIIGKRTIIRRVIGLLISVILCLFSFGFAWLGHGLNGLGGSPNDKDFLTGSYNLVLFMSVALTILVFCYWLSPTRKKLHTS